MKLYDWYRQTIRNPKYRWWIIVGTIAYLVLPFDLAPDFLPIIGQVDDVLLITLLLSEISQLLIDRVKTHRGQGATFTSTDSTPDTATEPVATEPVDVNAVSVD